MYVGIIKGKKIRFTNKDYESLKRKWNPKNVVEGRTGSKIPGGCSLCRYACIDCPLDVFTIKAGAYKHGCGQVINYVLRGKFIQYLTTFSDAYGTMLSTKVGTTKKYMQKIQDVLGTFKKESGGNESSG